MKKTILILTLFLTFSAGAQLNVDSLGRINYLSLHLTMLNDVWGYVDEMGNEYGLVGCEKGTSVVDLTTPSNPTEVFWEPGTQSVWRDLKTYGDYAYVTTEAQSGLLIIDLSPLPGAAISNTSYYTGPIGSEWQSAHNLFIDSSGYAYIFGANRGNGGVIILDVFTDPMNPIEVGTFDDWYAHDGYVLHDTMFLGNISDGFMSIIDVTDKANPLILGTQFTPSTFSHNVWATSDGDYAFTTDEVSGGYIGAYDVSDPTNILEVDRIQSSPGSGVIPHNTHVLNNHIVTSYYSDGVVIHDITYPYNMIEVGNYDTYFDQTTSYDGCWGAFPFLPSGLILATDRSEGLFVLGPTYVQAAYLEGLVTDAVTTNPILSADVQITGSNQLENTIASGFYATGMAASGTYDVTYNKVGYVPQTISVTLNSGIITAQDVQLVPIPPYSLTVNVFEQGTGFPIDGANVRFELPIITHEGITNGLGQEVLTLFYEDNYEIFVGKWGYFTVCSTQFIDNSTGSIDIYLKKGIYDDFTFDFGWTPSGTATTGLWERGDPYGASSGSAPSDDISVDCGRFAYVTGNADTFDPDFDDVDNGTSILVSPVMDLSTYTEPYVLYSRWFYNFYGPLAIDDSLKVILSNGITTELIDIVGSDSASLFQWVDKSIKISDYIAITNTMQFFFKTSDLNPDINITEAGLDKFLIAEESELGLDAANKANVYTIFPNPTSDRITISGVDEELDYTIFSMDGAKVKNGTLDNLNNEVHLQHLKNGMYFIQLGDNVFKVLKSN